MNDTPLATFLATIDPRFEPLVRALDAAIADAGVALDSKYSYRMLLYARNGRFRDWVCGISATSKGVQLRFLHGTSMDDPAGLLRAGTSTLKTIDYASIDDVDAALATAYVKEAVARHEAATNG